MAVAPVDLPLDRRTPAAPSVRLARVRPTAVVLGRATETNHGLADAFSHLGYRASVADPATVRLGRGDLAVARVDVLPQLDGVEAGLWRLPVLERHGAHVLNGPVALLAAHDKLLTALLLGRAGVAQPQTAHVRGVSVPAFPPPYVVKPRFGSWGRDVYRCRTATELVARLEALSERPWFRRQGALVQALVEPNDRDLRVVVAGGRVVGGVERIAAPGEWRTNVALGASRRRARIATSARVLALRAVAALRLDLAGVDLLTDGTGRQLVLEVNGAVDFTVDYADDIFASAARALVGTVPAEDSYEGLRRSSRRS
jgi:[lysine-biosynthesis-protein LysW]--L-2-aminoadipate ligase